LSPEQRFSAIGSASCRACHRAIYEAWSASPHGVATAALDLDERVDTACKPCHAPLFDPDHPVMSSEDAVGCEACHGPGSVYSILAVMIDPLKREGAGIREGRQACPECHNPEHADHIERDFANEMRRVHQAPAIRQVQH
jgi:hypothetical protein